MRESEDKRVPALDDEGYIDPDEYRANQRKTFEEEIEAAIQAEHKGRKPPPMPTVADIIRNLRVMGLPYGFGNELLEELADYLEGNHRGKRGNTSGVDLETDWKNFLDYIEYREEGHNYGETVAKMAEGYCSTRAIEDSLKRARNFYKSSLLMMDESKYTLIRKYLGK